MANCPGVLGEGICVSSIRSFKDLTQLHTIWEFKESSTRAGHNLVHPTAEAAIEAVSGLARVSRDRSRYSLLTQTGSITSQFRRGNQNVIVTLLILHGNLINVRRQ